MKISIGTKIKKIRHGAGNNFAINLKIFEKQGF